jgi:ribosome maturation factor RimP
VITENTIRSLVAEKIEGTQYYILELDIKPGNIIKLELVSMGPVSILDCVDISRQIEHNLDREEEDFSLQVASPGIDKPLRDPRQYIKNVGRSLEIRLTEGIEVEGELMAADEKGIKLQTKRKERVPGKKKKILIEEELDLSYTEIKQAKIKINFK